MVWEALQKLTRQELVEGMLEHFKQMEAQVPNRPSRILCYLCWHP